MPRMPRKLAFPNSLYVYCTVIFFKINTQFLPAIPGTIKFEIKKIEVPGWVP